MQRWSGDQAEASEVKGWGEADKQDTASDGRAQKERREEGEGRRITSSRRARSCCHCFCWFAQFSICCRLA